VTHPKVRAWLGRHPRFVFHFTPSSASWLNAVEGLFAKLSRQRLKRGAFCSVCDLQVAINRFLEETNDHPSPSYGTADPDAIIAAVMCGRPRRSKGDLVCCAAVGCGHVSGLRCAVLGPLALM
jgi:hypothetical protein